MEKTEMDQNEEGVKEYTGLGDPDNLIVQKTKPLFSLIHSPLTLSQLRIVDAYLGRINSRDDSIRLVKFEKGELESLLDVAQIRKEDLERRLKGLFTSIRIDDPTKPEGFTMIALFEKAQAYRDEETGLWTVALECSQPAREYIFNIENIGYLRYALKSVLHLTSRYSFALYMYLEQNRKIRKNLTWTVPLDILRNELECNGKTYEEYKFFNSYILKKCQEEMARESDCHFTYKPFKSGRKVTGVTFTLEPRHINPVEDDQNQTEIGDIVSVNEEDNDKLLLLLTDACSERKPDGELECEFTRNDMKYITDLVCQIDEDDLPVAGKSLDERRYAYLRAMYLRFLGQKVTGQIGNPKAYFSRMITTDIENIQEKKAEKIRSKEREEEANKKALEQMRKLQEKMKKGQEEKDTTQGK